MAISYTKTLFNPIYRTAGVPAVLTIGSDVYEGLTVRDMTSGVALGDPAVQSETPIARIRASELLVNGIDPDTLDGSSLEFNSVVWSIASHRPLGGPNGDSDGEILLMLEANG